MQPSFERRAALVLASALAVSACTGDDGPGDDELGSETVGDESGEDATTGESGETGESSETTGPGVEGCGYGEGAGGLTFSIAVEDPTAHLLTEAERPDTGEVYCVPSKAGGPRAIVMVPGLGLSHYVYLTTPDRREGWATVFANAGVTAHALNPKRNLSPASDPAPPDNASIWLEEDFWDRWGFGPVLPEPYPDVRFPVEEVEDFKAHLPYYGPGPGGTGISQGAVDELVELLEAVGPAVLMVHSAAGPAGFQVALDHPELVQAMVVVEPTGCPEQMEGLPDMPFLAVYGDYIQARGQAGRLAACTTTAQLATAAGHPGALFSYPDMDVFGNTHLLMQDDNNDAIAGDILGWLEQKVWR